MDSTPVDVLRVMRERWVVTVLTLCLCLGLGAVGTLLTPKLYQARSQVFVTTVLPNDAGALAAANTFATARVQSYVSLATAPGVTDPVARQLGLNITGSQLAKQITAEAPPNTVLINITVRDRSAGRSAAIANAVADRFGTVVQDLEEGRNGTDSPVRVSLTNPAGVPSAPVRPRPALNMLLALFGGLLAAAAAAMLRERFGGAVKSAAQVQALTGCQVLGAVPRERKGSKHASSSRNAQARLRVDSLALIASNLQFLDIGTRPRVIAFTSATAQERKTELVTRLGVALSRLRPVCLVDVNLHAPSFMRYYLLGQPAGFTSAVAGYVPARRLPQEIRENLTVVPTGPVPPYPGELLGSDVAHEVVRGIAETADLTLLDAPAVLPQGDGARAALLADATILVIRANRANRRDIEKAMAELAALGGRASAVVMTDAPRRVAQKLVREFQGERSASAVLGQPPPQRRTGKDAADAAPGLPAAASDRAAAPAGRAPAPAGRATETAGPAATSGPAAAAAGRAAARSAAHAGGPAAPAARPGGRPVVQAPSRPADPLAPAPPGGRDGQRAR